MTTLDIDYEATTSEPTEAAQHPPKKSPIERIRESHKIVGELNPIFTQGGEGYLSNVGGKSYVCYGGAIALAAAYGWVVSTSPVKWDAEQNAWHATGKLIDQDTGAIIAEAEGYVGSDEKRWSSAQTYARNSMVATRAGAKVCGMVLRHLYLLVGADVGTPFEEMVDLETSRTSPAAESSKAAAPVAASTPRPAPTRPAPAASDDGSESIDTKIISAYEEEFKMKSGEVKTRYVVEVDANDNQYTTLNRKMFDDDIVNAVGSEVRLFFTSKTFGQNTYYNVAKIEPVTPF